MFTRQHESTAHGREAQDSPVYVFLFALVAGVFWGRVHKLGRVACGATPARVSGCTFRQGVQPGEQLPHGESAVWTHYTDYVHLWQPRRGEGDRHPNPGLVRMGDGGHGASEAARAIEPL
jgi:hypothetical protein